MNVVDEPDFTEEEAESFHVQADMTRQIMDYVRVEKLTLKSAANLFNLQEGILERVIKGQLGVLSDDELGDRVNLILARSF